ncbi:MAG: hypothetical protein AAGE59_31805 [Cyanobacteria bacterium P01_F01_bin.86]
MAKQTQCPECGHSHLKRIGVRGVRKCGSCGTFVDIRNATWWRRWLSA